MKLMKYGPVQLGGDKTLGGLLKGKKTYARKKPAEKAKAKRANEALVEISRLWK